MLRIVQQTQRSEKRAKEKKYKKKMEGIEKVTRRALSPEQEGSVCISMTTDIRPPLFYFPLCSLTYPRVISSTTPTLFHWCGGGGGCPIDPSLSLREKAARLKSKDFW
eukprot:Hpha_TRINITY_DN16287_c2_g18::TRINITY_DN16287_c2_g18_i1::g.11739::m.11739